jgi:hypothetical protein
MHKYISLYSSSPLEYYSCSISHLADQKDSAYNACFVQDMSLLRKEKHGDDMAMCVVRMEFDIR